MGDKFIDSTLNENSNKGNITQFFRAMSLNKFNVIGKTIYVKTPHKRKWYLDNKKNRTFINADIISEVDSSIDFKDYDNWTIKGRNNFIFSPDGKVDMIWIIFRNIANDMEDPGKTAAGLGFATYLSKDNIQKWSGEASLGYGFPIKVDSEKMNC